MKIAWGYLHSLFFFHCLLDMHIFINASFIFANTPEGVRRNTLIVDQAKTSSRLLYFGPGQQLQAEAKCVFACHWSMKYRQVPNFIPRHFLISDSANCPFLLCFAQAGTHQEQLWKHFYRQLTLSLNFRAGISSQTSREWHLWLPAPSQHGFPCTEIKRKELKTSTFTFSSKVHILLHWQYLLPVIIPCYLVFFNNKFHPQSLEGLQKIELHLSLLLPYTRTLFPESIPLAIHIFKTHKQSISSTLPWSNKSFSFPVIPSQAHSQILFSRTVTKLAIHFKAYDVQQRKNWNWKHSYNREHKLF